MRALYLDCGMGAAGDMVTAALLELFPAGEREGLLEELNGLGLPGVRLVAERARRCGIWYTLFRVLFDCAEGVSGAPHARAHAHDGGHGHAHSSLADIEHLVRGHLGLPSRVADDVMSTYGLIAAAESRAHGVPVGQVHFHEVGALDAVADVTAACLLMDRLAPDVVVASPVNVGAGTVRCAHGTLPVPVPAVAEILRGVPTYGGQVRCELCTPTGAALLRHFVSDFGDMPLMTTDKVGYGMGERELEQANCVRAFLGTTADEGGRVCELTCCVDDMTGEELGFAAQELLGAGALEAYTVPLGMKKSRPGTLLCVMCPPERADEFVGLVFRLTTTLGVRESECRRHVLSRATEVVRTPVGDVRRKVSSGYGVTRTKLEYDDLARIARERGVSLADARALAERADGSE